MRSAACFRSGEEAPPGGAGYTRVFGYRRSTTKEYAFGTRSRGTLEPSASTAYVWSETNPVSEAPTA
jgi:hypothetical protein